jgi:hypothetical protein
MTAITATWLNATPAEAHLIADAQRAAHEARCERLMADVQRLHATRPGSAAERRARSLLLAEMDVAEAEGWDD